MQNFVTCRNVSCEDILIDLVIVVVVIDVNVGNDAREQGRGVIIAIEIASKMLPMDLLLIRQAAGWVNQEDDGNQPETAAGQSQGEEKCAHRPHGASQPPKPATGGASTSYPHHPPTPPELKALRKAQCAFTLY